MIHGPRVTLRPFTSADLPALRRWHDDGEVMIHWSDPQPLVTEHAFADDLAPGGRFTRFQENGYFCICDAQGRPLGRIEYEGLHHRHRTCELGIYLGEKDAWSQGYGSEAIVLLLDWLFNQRSAHRVWLTTHIQNLRAQRAYEKVGFVRSGVWRECYYYDGRWHDEVAYDLLDREFNARYRPDGFAARQIACPP
jgi:RimJ/RimL family protein N-acetyltransferase